MKFGLVVANSTMPANLDVISASSLVGNIHYGLLTKDNTLTAAHPSYWGYIVFHETLGDMGYLTDNDLPYLFKFDRDTKATIDKFEIPIFHAAYEDVFSPINKHIFLRAIMCCSCEFNGAELGNSCGRSILGYSVSPTTGNVSLLGLKVLSQSISEGQKGKGIES